MWTLSAFADEAGGSLDEQIAALQRAGIRYIDLRNVDGHNISALPLDHAEKVREKLDAAGIRVAMFGSPIGKIDIADDLQIDLDKLRHLGQLSKILNCRAVRIFSYYNRKERRPFQDWRQESFRRLQALRDEAERLGLVLYHENEGEIFGDHPQENLEIARTFRDGRTFRIIFDFSNFNISGDDVWKAWELLRDVVDGFHLKDSDTSKQHVPLGQGAGYVRQILSDALQRGWQGPMTLEPHLTHSKAVMATGPSGKPNQQFSELTPAESFHIAAQTATQLLRDIGASFQ